MSTTPGMQTNDRGADVAPHQLVQKQTRQTRQTKTTMWPRQRNCWWKPPSLTYSIWAGGNPTSRLHADRISSVRCRTFPPRGSRLSGTTTLTTACCVCGVPQHRVSYVAADHSVAYCVDAWWPWLSQRWWSTTACRVGGILVCPRKVEPAFLCSRRLTYRC
jgi:hypothetical protein